MSLHWRHNDHGGVSNHQRHGCLLNRLFRRRSKKTSKLRVTGLCAGPVNSPHKGPVTRKMVPFDDVIMWIPSAISTARQFICIGCGLTTRTSCETRTSSVQSWLLQTNDYKWSIKQTVFVCTEMYWSVCEQNISPPLKKYLKTLECSNKHLSRNKQLYR